MEYVRRRYKSDPTAKSVQVLILILMEYVRRPRRRPARLPRPKVLILILMEYVRRPKDWCSFAILLASLNPYSNGICPKTLFLITSLLSTTFNINNSKNFTNRKKKVLFLSECKITKNVQYVKEPFC